ncbi:MAG: RlmE family RNA methyltransferase [Myxococcota bacterium]
MSRKRRRRQNPYGNADFRTRAAKASGFAARSVFKLEEIDRRLRLLKPGQKVLDLGASPGSWSAYAASRIGAQGKLVAIDLKPLTQPLPGYCTVLEGDAYDDRWLEDPDSPMVQSAPFDVVLSDMAPNTTGDRTTDKIRSHEVFMRALELGSRLVREGGSFVGKIFMGGDFPIARDEVRRHFENVRTLRPEAVRDVSYEVFLVGTNRRAAVP